MGGIVENNRAVICTALQVQEFSGKTSYKFGKFDCLSGILGRWVFARVTCTYGVVGKGVQVFDIDFKKNSI